MIPSPLRFELLKDVTVGEIQVDRGGRHAIVTEDLLHGRQGDRVLEGQGRLGMVEDAQSNLASELDTVRDSFDDLLGLARGDEPDVVQGEIGFQDSADARREEDNPLFAP
jgi:hypothetical protein